MNQSQNPQVEAARRAEPVLAGRSRGCRPGGPAEAQQRPSSRQAAPETLEATSVKVTKDLLDTDCPEVC